MRNFKMTVSYDGTRYNGWQIQKNTPATIQQKLEDLLSHLAGEKVEVIGSGRTDAGVHAKGQVANVHLDYSGTDRELMDYLNQYLPEDIAVLEVTEVEERFHARYSCTSKCYRYRIQVGSAPNVFERKYLYRPKVRFYDVEKMREAAKPLLGTHDFMAFCGNRKMKKSTVRTITDIQIREIPDESGELSELSIDYTGDGFLQNMVRILTGTLLEAGLGRIRPEDIPEILDSRDRQRAGFTAPPEGLCLMEVRYGAE